MAFERHASQQVKIQQVNAINDSEALQGFRRTWFLDVQRWSLEWKTKKSASWCSSTSIRNPCCHKSTTSPAYAPVFRPSANQPLSDPRIPTALPSAIRPDAKSLKIQDSPLQILSRSSRLRENIKLYLHSWWTISRCFPPFNAETWILTIS